MSSPKLADGPLRNSVARKLPTPLLLLLLLAVLVSPTLLAQSGKSTFYVNASNTTPVAPFATWATAATNIQDALDVAATGDEILVTNGVYGTGARAVYGMSNRVAITQAVTVRSVNGPEFTTIVGSGVSGPAAVRCAYLTNGAVLAGFTLTRGATRLAGDFHTSQSAGAVWCEAAGGVVSNCTLTGNSAAYSGGGAYRAMLINCTLTNNSASYGGGDYYGILKNCTVAGNSGTYGGGSYHGLLTNCVVKSNSAQEGGGIHSGTLNNCLLTGNSASGSGGGAYDSILNNCSLAGNFANAGGGAYFGTINNSIVFYNTASSGGNYSGAVISYCCTTPLPPGTGNLSSDPQFTDTNQWSNLRLRGGSPCINAGNNSYAVGTTDLDGNPRITGAAVDMGAYEFQPVHYVAPNSNNPLAPYNSWATAATNIQDAIDVSRAGDEVVVTNGVYTTGGRALYGMSNRVAVIRAVTVRSVNGPEATRIEGLGPNGPAAVRCVYLTNGAVLAGFTLANGATQNSGDAITNRSGGGIWCESVSGVVSNCVLTGNGAAANGGGAYGGMLNNCALTGNSAQQNGGGAFAGMLNNCTLTGNSAASGGGIYSVSANNCLVYYNTAFPTGANYDDSSTLNYCCTTPLPAAGTGNTDAEPQMASVTHLSTGSPCLAAGNAAYAHGVDIDGELWANPPAIGCDELWSGSATGPLSAAIVVSYTNVGVGVEMYFQGLINGRVSASRWDFGDGVVVSNRPWASHAWAAPGSYVVELRAYNDTYPAGIAASITMQVGAQTHYVAQTASNPLPPYTSWTTAAISIQDALDVAGAGDEILVTNGVYASGARAVYGMSNRVAVTRAVTVRSVNGPDVTSIAGSGAYGPDAVRCVYLADGALLAGFTLTGGATQMGTDDFTGSGGGVWCESGSVMISNCVLTANRAWIKGGGAFQGTLSNCILTSNLADEGAGACDCTLQNCFLTANWAYLYGGGVSDATLYNCSLVANSVYNFGGGAYQSTLNNSLLTGNSALQDGGGAYESTLNNCTLTSNSAALRGGGAYWGTLNNCLVYYNTAPGDENHHWSTMNYCCTWPLPPDGVGNTDAEPQLASASHLSASSPCIGKASSTYAQGTDIDGEPWAFFPAIGCDEYWNGSATGTLSVEMRCSHTNVATGFAVDFQALIEGRVSASRWDFGGGVVVSNRPWTSHAWAAPGSYLVELRAYNDSYPTGIAVSVTVQVVPQQVHYVALTSTNPVPPYTSWDTAATNIQDAVDAAGVGDEVLVTNGVYATRGGVVYGMSNRVAVTRPVRLLSVNGPEVTSIIGSGPNGSAAVRCVYLTGGSFLAGFTLTNGATQTNYDVATASGGGAWCESWSAVVSNCVFTGNEAWGNGGGAYQGALQDCAFTGNSAAYGGAAYASKLRNCVVMSNSAQNGGGAAYGGTIEDSTLVGNSAVSEGGGAYFSTLIDCAVMNNSASYGGGAGGSSLINCTVSGNLASHDGGGTYFGMLTNCSLTANSATNGGGSFSSTLINCTLANNSAARGGGAYAAALTGCTLKGNAANEYGGGAHGGTLNNCSLISNLAKFGGGAEDSTLDNCTLTGNSAENQGGAAYYATLNNCEVISNTASFGGGVYYGALSDCTVSGNSASRGGGLSHATLGRCVLINNRAENGGGAALSTLYNCTLTQNSASNYGGGVYYCQLTNCLLVSNSAKYGGGAYATPLNNCTLADNSAGEFGGGACYCNVNNSIVYYNSSPNSANYYSGNLHYSCTTPLPEGTGNFSNEPRFIDTNGWSNLRLQSNSPCINAGNNACVPVPTDLDGNPRISGGTVDAGAYELQSPASVLPYYWLEYWGMATDGSSDYADPDHDALNTWQEWIAGTNPTNAASSFRMLSATGTIAGVTVVWTSVTDRTYAVERAPSVEGAPAYILLQSNIAGLPGTTSWTDTNVAPSAAGFYRVRVEN